MGAVFNRRAVLTAQRLYLIEGWKAGDIAEKLDVTPDQMYRLIRSKGWGKKKKEQEAKIDKIAESTDAALIEEDQEFRESLKIRAMQMVDQGLDIAESQSNARDFASAAAGTKNFMELYEKAAGMGGNVTQNVQNNTLNIMSLKTIYRAFSKGIMFTILDKYPFLA